jgi:hypothetical protein
MPVPEGIGCQRRALVLAQEMATAIAARLSVVNHKNKDSQTLLIEFQRWIIYVGGLIRKGKLKALSQQMIRLLGVPQGYRDLLFMQSGRELARRVKALAEVEGKSSEHIYRLLRRMRGGNVVTLKGVHRKVRKSK